jgi:hypothetical protein
LQGNSIGQRGMMWNPPTRPDHTFLDPGDDCYYLGEYTARAGYAFSTTNDIIQNLKKPMDRRGRPEWKWKTWAINRSAEMLREVLPESWFTRVTFVPVPPSRAKDHPEYDDRLLQVLRKVGEGRALDIRELVLMTESIDAAHLTDDRRRVNYLVRRMRVERSLADPEPSAICIFDDVLTTGAHFKAVQAFLHSEFPHVPLAGLFLARRAPEASPV